MSAEGLDVIGVEDPGEPVWRRRVPRWGLALVAVGGVLCLGAGLLAVAGERMVSRPGAGVGAGAVPLTAQVAVIGQGGTASRDGEGARGSVRFEVRNGGPQVRVLSLAAEVAGVSFNALVPPNGVTLLPEERIELAVSFVIADCSAIGREGRVVVRTATQGREDELVQPVLSSDQVPMAGRVVLQPVFSVCSG